jgi:Holliday junction resolvase
MRPRPGVEWRDIVERRWRNGVEVLRGEVGGLYIDVDIMWDVVGRVGWIVMFVEAR